MFEYTLAKYYTLHGAVSKRLLESVCLATKQFHNPFFFFLQLFKQKCLVSCRCSRWISQILEKPETLHNRAPSNYTPTSLCSPVPPNTFDAIALTESTCPPRGCIIVPIRCWIKAFFWSAAHSLCVCWGLAVRVGVEHFNFFKTNYIWIMKVLVFCVKMHCCQLFQTWDVQLL